MADRREMNTAEYLKRIGIEAAALPPTAETLRRLQRAHLLAVPFENLDIHWNRPILLDTSRVWKKIVVDRRGGVCYELNGLFNELLRSIGFVTRLISARVARPDGTFGLEFDHAAIIVSIDDGEFLADVGFGEFTAEPLKLVAREKQVDAAGLFMIDRIRDGAYLVKKRTEEFWTNEYLFVDTARDLSEFAEMCGFQQYSPESHFTKGKLCSIMTQTGRKTLTDDKLIVTANGKRNEQAIGTPEDFDQALKSEFGITRPA